MKLKEKIEKKKAELKKAFLEQEMTMGAKNPKKEITLNRNQTIGFFICMILIFGGITLGIVTLIGGKDLTFTCTDGTIEEVQFNKTYYCGAHFTITRGALSEKEFTRIEKAIYRDNVPLYYNEEKLGVN